jgi:heme A synthase
MDILALEGVIKIANLVLAVVAGTAASTLFMKAWRRKELRPWRYLIFALILFAFQELLGALRAFDIFSSPYLTHINVSVILGLLIAAIVLEITIKKYGVGN